MHMLIHSFIHLINRSMIFKNKKNKIKKIKNKKLKTLCSFIHSSTRSIGRLGKKKQLKTLGAEKAAMEADPLFGEYMKKITDKGFFKGLEEEGSKGKWVSQQASEQGGQASERASAARPSFRLSKQGGQVSERAPPVRPSSRLGVLSSEFVGGTSHGGGRSTAVE